MLQKQVMPADYVMVAVQNQAHHLQLTGQDTKLAPNLPVVVLMYLLPLKFVSILGN